MPEAYWYLSVVEAALAPSSTYKIHYHAEYYRAHNCFWIEWLGDNCISRGRTGRQSVTRVLHNALIERLRRKAERLVAFVKVLGPACILRASALLAGQGDA